MICKHCGYNNEETDAFCAMCGKAVEQEIEETSVLTDTQPEYQQEAEYAQTYAQPQQAYAPQQPYAPQQAYTPQQNYAQPQQAYAPQQNYAQQPYYAPVQPVVVQPVNPGKGAGIAALVFGIISWILCNPLCSFSLVAVICGSVGRKKSKAADMKNGVATAGLVLGLIPIIITALAVIAAIVTSIVMIATMGVDEFMWMLEDILDEIVWIIEDILYEIGLY